MTFLRRYWRWAALITAVVGVSLALVIVTAPDTKPATPRATVGELLGQVGRPLPASMNGQSEITDSQISVYQDKIRLNAKDAVSLARLGLAYLQKAREVADPTYYGKAEGVLKKALELDPKSYEAMGGMGSLSLSRHQFSQGLEWGKKAQALKPELSYNYGVMGDALVELGRYEEAAQVVQTMVNLRPDLSSYSRVSYLRELRGQYEGAIEAMKQAVTATGPTAENRAWVTYQLGSLYFSRGDLDQAEATFQEALAGLPNYNYAQIGMARVKAARGDVAGAITTYSQIVQRMPLAEFIIELGDLYTVSGNQAEAKKQYDLVRAIQKIYSDNGVDTDLELALFNADHDYQLPESLAKARQEMNARPSVKASDVLAWTLYKTGDYQGAQQAIQQALRLGTQDGLMYFHAGMIAAKLGQTNEARSWLDKALRLNPQFSFLYAPQARQSLTELGGPPVAKS